MTRTAATVAALALLLVLAGCGRYPRDADDMTAQAAERGMGLLGVSLGTPDEYAQRVRDYRRIIQDCEPVGKFVNNQVNGVGWMYCGESDEEGMKTGGAGAAAFMGAAIVSVCALVLVAALTTLRVKAVA